MNKIILGLIFFCMANIVFANVADIYEFDSPIQAKKFRHLLNDLRCLVCQNQNLADSNADLAKDLKKQVYIKVKENQSEQEIVDYLINRYGSFILFNPPMQNNTYFLWFLPGILLMIGVLLWLQHMKFF